MNRFTFIALIILSLSISSLAQETKNTHSLVDRYSLDELINLKITTAEKHEQKIEDVTANVEIITKQQIEQYGFTTLHDIITNITGLYFIEDHYWLGSSNYGVRGYFKTGPFSNVAILINGVNQLSDKYSDYPDVKITLPIEAVERIEVIKGPMAVMYGNGAFFGVINIITEHSDDRTDNFNQFHANVCSNNGYKASFNLGNKINDFSYRVIIGGRQSGGPDIKYTDLTSDTSYLEYVGLTSNSTTGGHLEYSDIYSGIQLKYKDLKIDLSYNESDKGVYDGSPSFNNGNSLNTQATNLFVEYRKYLMPELEISANISYFNHNHLLNYELFRKYYYEIDYQKTNSYYLETHLKWQPSEKLRLLGGIGRRTVESIIQLSDFAYYGLNYGDGMAGLPEGEDYSTHSIYTDLEYRITDRLKIGAGLRVENLQSYDMYLRRGVLSEDSIDQRPVDPENYYLIESTYYPENNGWSFVPRVAMILQPVKQHFLKLMFGEAIKYPSFSENYRQLPDMRMQLDASKIKTLELNYYTYAYKYFIINTSLFFNHLEKIIELTNFYNIESSTWDIYSSNSGRLNTYGVEGMLIFMPLSRLDIQISSIYQKTLDMREGYENIDVAYSPSFLGYARLNYNLPGLFSIGMNYRYIGRMETAWNTASTPGAGSRLANAADGYSILELNLRKDNIANKNIYVNFTISNLLNEDYRYPTTKSNAWIDYGVPGEKICFSFGTGVKF